MSKKDYAALVGFIGACLFVIRVVIVAEDIRAIIEDPNEANKPGEILKLVFDLA